MPRALDQDELIERWTLLGEELERSRAKRGANGLAFALLWKFFLQHARFPRGRSEVPDEAVAFVGGQLGLPASELGFYDWTGRTVERHRAEIRQMLGFRECTLADQDAAVDWLVEHVTTAEQRHDQVRLGLLAWLRSEGVEPPTAGQLDRVVRSAVDRGERALIDRICRRLPGEVRERLNELVFGVPDDPQQGEADGHDAGVDEGRDLLGWMKTDPGRLSLNTMLTEIAKLEAIRALGLPVDVPADVAPRIVTSWRVRAAVQSPSHFREFTPATRWVLLTALLIERQREITDTLVDLLISTVHAINARADLRVTEEMVATSSGSGTRTPCWRGWPRPAWPLRTARSARWCSPSPVGRRRCGKSWPKPAPRARSSAATCRSSYAPPTPTTTAPGC
ncbi:MAG: DUF4158 domain-containing protein [Pseudonocardiaceae bacterium]